MKTFFLMLSLSVAQLGLAQITIFSKTTQEYDLTSEEVTGSFARIQSFNISFPDSLLIHNIFNDDFEINDSQIYRITGVEEKDGVIGFTTLSGLSGRSYQYLLKTVEESLVLIQLFNEDQTMYLFEGSDSKMKTFIQSE
jgi:hypothetical protein